MSGPIAAVTGASRGIGRAIALALAADGYQVFALARSTDDLQALAAAHSGIVPLALDIADDASRRAAVEAIMAETGAYGLDVLVSNAGYGLLGPVEEVETGQLRRQFEVNVVGLLAFAQPFLPAMRARRYGRLIMISSAAGRISTPFMGAYSASKFALEGLSDALRVELSPFGVKVVLIEPGPIATEFGRAAEKAGHSDSPYAPYERRWHGVRGASNVGGRSAETVARVVMRAIRAEHPRPRYAVTISARLGTVARRVVPDRALDFVFRRAMGA